MELPFQTAPGEGWGWRRRDEPWGNGGFLGAGQHIDPQNRAGRGRGPSGPPTGRLQPRADRCWADALQTCQRRSGTYNY